MSDHTFLRMTIDVCVFTEEDSRPGLKRLANTLKLTKHNGNERLAREFMEAIKDGTIEIDDVFDVEDHS